MYHKFIDSSVPAGSKHLQIFFKNKLGFVVESGGRLCVYVDNDVYKSSGCESVDLNTGWRKSIGWFKLQVISRKRAVCVCVCVSVVLRYMFVWMFVRVGSYRYMCT